MKKFSYFVFIVLLLVACGKNLPCKDCSTFVEADDPATDTLANWSKLPKNLQVSFGSIDARYGRSSIPLEEKITAWAGAGWRGERISAQVALWTAHEVEQIECVFSQFTSQEGTMSAEIAQARFVRYVLTDIFDPGCGHRRPENFPVSLAPDMLDTLKCFDMPAKTTRPVWLTFDIPPDAKPGIYSGSLYVYARKQKKQKLDIQIEVLPQTLPKPTEWAFHLDLWQHPSAIARINNVKPWSEEHWILLEEPMKMLANAGQKVITATINKEPWNNQCFDAYEDMIIWTKNEDSSWSYDYAVFDRWVELMMSFGVKKMINCYSMIPWNNELHYFDAATQAFVTIRARPGTQEFVDLWTPFLIDFRRHLTDKGWIRITNIAMDERSPRDMKATIDLLTEVAPEFGIALADNHKSYRQYPFLKDICLAFGETFDEDDIAFRRENGLISTYYVCCSDRFPNVFTFSDPAEGAYIGWYAIAAGFDGFLRWAYNSWVEDPVIDSRFRTWPAGDTYIVYPNARSSIRFERLREGIQDAEKIRILREKFASQPQKLQQLNAAVEKFNIHEKPATPANEMLREAKETLRILSL